MAEINDLDLKLNIIANDEASEALKELAGVLDALKESLAEFDDLNPFAKMDEAATDLSDLLSELDDRTTDLRDVLDAIGESDALVRLSDDMADLNGQGSRFTETLADMRDELVKTLDEAERDPFEAWSAPIKDIQDALRAVLEDTMAIDSDAGKAPFSDMVKSVQQLNTELSTTVDEVQKLAEGMRAVVSGEESGLSSAIAALGNAANGTSSSRSGSKSLPELTAQEATTWFSQLNESQVPESLKEAYQKAQDEWLGWNSTTANEEAPLEFYNQFRDYMNAQNAPAPSKTPAVTKTPVPSWLNSVNGANSLMNELPMKFLTTGMNAMMGYYGIQSLVNAGNNFQYINQLRTMNNMSVNGAAQAYAMLASAGMSGSSGVSFLSNLAGNLQNIFTPQVGTGALSQQAIELESLGINQADTVTSPWELLNTIGTQYRKFLSQGQGTKASQLLNLTGTTQLAPLLSNWNSMEQQMSGINLNMTPSQLNNAVKQNMTLQGDMQQLGLAFASLAVKLEPLVGKITNAVTGIANAINSGKGPIGDLKSAIESVAKNLGALPLVFTGVAASIKATSFTFDVLSGMGVLGEVGGKLTLGKLLGKGIGGIGRLLGIGGTAAEAGEGAAEAGLGIAGGLEAAGAAADATGVGLPIGLALGGIGVLVAGLTELGTHFKQVSQFTKQAGNDISKWSSEAGQHISSWAQNAGDHIHNWADVSSNEFYNWVGNTSQRISQWATNTDSNVRSGLNSMFNRFSTWGQDLGSDFQTWSGDIRTRWDTWGTDLLSDFSSWSDTIKTDFHAWGTDLGRDYDSWSQTIRSDWNTWGTNLRKDFGGWSSTINSDWNTWGTDLRRYFSSWSGTIGSDWSTWGKDLHTEFGSWSKTISGSWTSWGSTLNKDFGSWSKTVSNSWNSWGKSLDSDLKNFTKSTSLTWNSWMTNLGNSLSSLWQKVKNWFGGGNGVTSTPVKLSGTVTSWIKDAMKDAGVSGSAWLNTLEHLVSAESGGNPNAVNSQTVDGQHATGIAQMLPSTFAEYMKAGMNNILNPIDNLTASIRYILTRYGSPHNLVAKTGLGSSNYVGYATGGILQEPIVGIGLNSGTHYMLGEDGPEAVVPLNGSNTNVNGGLPTGGTAPRRNVNQNFNIQVVLQGTSNNARQMAQQVADELVRQLKLRGNFDWSF
ncbi:transglycosylase SLT domain-containing protein [Alicyclobacillus fastidiosus]|uniref:Transglycosylase SLT domain-containing protein n=1 Tax=Alicyclobacillus fastidiosus TaxID=392011 RepID=A0ABV5AKG3_9BACL|nr:transglycosylase SLT domain-containing protein [Alicyclobacillus fastidiosus]WEH08475.1 transglycosylase SLT domain-containing protein [Alicyclobacillus fastidiosus]